MIAIVTDSTAGISRQEALHMGVRVVPISYTLAGHSQSESYVEPHFTPAPQLYAGGQTASPNPAIFMGVFEELTRQGYDVLCVTISSRLSGTYNNANLAAREIGGERVRVVDSLTTAGGLYLLVTKAAQMLRDGMDMPAITATLERMRWRIGIAFTVEDIAPLRRSGRLGLVRQSVGTILNRKPLLLCKNGVLTADDMIRGRQEQAQRLLTKLPDSLMHAIIHYADRRQAALALAQAVEERFPGVPVQIRPLGCVLGIHLGAGPLGIAYLGGI